MSGDWLQVLADLFAVIAPVFAGAGLGFAWARHGQPFDHEMVTGLVTRIGAPCLVFSTLTRLDVSLAAFGEMAAAALISYAVMAVAGAAILFALKLPNHSYLPSLVFGNIGNMGLPLCLFAYGNSGLSLAIAVFAIGSMLQFTIGIWITSGHTSLLTLLRTPVLHGIVAALFFMLNGTQPPQWLLNSTQVLGGLMIPLMLLALGVSLARLKVRSLLRSTAFSVLRLGGGFLAGAGTAAALGMTGPARGVLIVQSAMPVAVFNYLFAQQYRRAPDEVAGMIVISTLISFATLPLLLYAVLEF